jgi:acid phosphatase type 7
MRHRILLALALPLIGSAPAHALASPGVSAAPVLIAAGDIACRPGRLRTAVACHHPATALLAARLRPAVVAVLGDAQYDRATRAEFLGSFGPTWGRLGARLRPAAGNHEYLTAGAAPYYSYFGARAGPRGLGYYSYDLGAWHVVVLNSNCAFVSCARGSAQEGWLRADLAAHPASCTLAYWHHPRFTSGVHRDNLQVAPLWAALYEAGADVVLSGHDHDYERMSPQNPAGRRDLARGIREFVVGTGGEDQRRFLAPKPNSERRSTGTFGVLAMTLRPGSYSWRFVPEPGRSFRDSGSGACH